MLAALLVLSACSADSYPPDTADVVSDTVSDTNGAVDDTYDPEIGEEPGDEDDESDEPMGSDPMGSDPMGSDPDGESETVSDTDDGEWNDGSLAKAGYDPTLQSDGPCLDNEGDPVDGITYKVAHRVVGGELGAACFGSENENLIEAWYILSDITPPDQLRDLTVFAGFESAEQGSESSTLAFVVPVDNDGSQFQMAVNLPASRNDWDEAALTMAHEFSHVFTAVPSELNRYASEGDCATYDNLEGCYVDGSIMADWYARFWPELGYDPSGGQQADEVDGEARCDANPGFFGAYGASNPEEDFAEAFAAYVMRVEAATDAQQERLDWIDQFAGLREFRERAEATGYGPFQNNFGECGLNN